MFCRCNLKILKLSSYLRTVPVHPLLVRAIPDPAGQGASTFFAGWLSTGPMRTLGRKKGHLRVLLRLKKKCVFRFNHQKISSKERKLGLFCLFAFAASLIKMKSLFHLSWKLVCNILVTLYFPREDMAFDTFFPGGHCWKLLICVMCTLFSFLAVLLHMRQWTLQLELS